MLHDDKPALDEALLVHYGVKGMKWGQRKSGTPGVPRKTDRDAANDAKEFARAKMFYGQGAGTRRKLIKAKVESKSARDPLYKKAFDNHSANQNLDKHADKAKGERKRKDTKEKVRKTGNSINRALNGPYAGSAAIALVGAGAAYAKNQNLDKKAADFARKRANNAAMKRDVNKLLRSL